MAARTSLLTGGRPQWVLRVIIYLVIPLVIVGGVTKAYYDTILKPARQRTNQEAVEVFYQARKLQQETNYRVAVLKYLEILERNPESPWLLMVYYHIGNIYLEHLGDIPKAKYAYQHFVKYFPDHILAGDVRRRLAYIEKVGDFNGEPYYLYHQAKLDLRRHRYEDAIAKMKMIADRFPDSGLAPELYVMIAYIYKHHLNDSDHERHYNMKFTELFFPLTAKEVMPPFLLDVD